ncbi:MAG: DUF4190 domain-containing protein [Phycisphaerales bacterium]
MSQITPPPSTETHHVSDKLSKVALWSMIIGIVSLCLSPLGLVALIMGIVGITKTSGEKMRGLGFAIAGTSLGVIGLVGGCLWIGILLPAVGAARQTAMQLMSSTQLRSIGQGMHVYAAQNNDLFPPVDQTFDILLEQGLIDTEILISPLEDGDGVSYILTGVPVLTFDAREIMAYEDPKHMANGVNVLFGDLHIELVSHEVFEQMLAEQEARMQAERNAQP